MHQITDDGLPVDSPDMERNLKMLSQIARDNSLKNVVIVHEKEVDLQGL
jgi:hypothetical protein